MLRTLTRPATPASNSSRALVNSPNSSTVANPSSTISNSPSDPTPSPYPSTVSNLRCCLSIVLAPTLLQFPFDIFRSLQVKSASRVGDSDLGVNAKRLNYIAAALRAKSWDAPPVGPN